LLIGVAGGATLVDRAAAGYTADWMRYMTTASLINRALVKFEFDWNELEWISALSARILERPDNARAENRRKPSAGTEPLTSPSSENPGQ